MNARRGNNSPVKNSKPEGGATYNNWGFVSSGCRNCLSLPACPQWRSAVCCWLPRHRPRLSYQRRFRCGSVARGFAIRSDYRDEVSLAAAREIATVKSRRGNSTH